MTVGLFFVFIDPSGMSLPVGHVGWAHFPRRVNKEEAFISTRSCSPPSNIYNRLLLDQILGPSHQARHPQKQGTPRLCPNYCQDGSAPKGSLRTFTPRAYCLITKSSEQSPYIPDLDANLEMLQAYRHRIMCIYIHVCRRVLRTYENEFVWIALALQRNGRNDFERSVTRDTVAEEFNKLYESQSNLDQLRREVYLYWVGPNGTRAAPHGEAIIETHRRWFCEATGRQPRW